MLKVHSSKITMVNGKEHNVFMTFSLKVAEMDNASGKLTFLKVLSIKYTYSTSSVCPKWQQCNQK